MDARRKSEPTAMKNGTTVERTSDRELVVTRTVNGPARIVFEAWTKAELFKRWWVPKSFGLDLLSCEIDVRTGGKYRLVFQHPASPEPMAFFGTYTEVTPNARIVWTIDSPGSRGTPMGSPMNSFAGSPGMFSPRSHAHTGRVKPA